jgi:excisionase family DNA binding protein
MDQQEILSTQQLAAECGLTEGRIRQLIGAGRIKATMFGGTHAISRQEVNRFKAERQRKVTRK